MLPHATPMYGLQRALYDGFAMAFLTQLNDECAPRVEGLLQRAFNPQNSKVTSEAVPGTGTHDNAATVGASMPV